MELHQLRYFVAIVDTGSFTKAAERCFISQPSLSQQVIKLENELGQQLFERIGKRVKTTAPGRALYERALNILGAVEEAKSCVQTEQEWMSGELGVGAILTVAPYLLPIVVRNFLDDYPHASITVRENFTEKLLADLLAGDLDVGILALPITDTRLEVEPLLTEELMLALPAGHHLASKDKLHLSDLNGENFVVLDEMHCLGQQVVRFCNHHECQTAVTCKTAQLLTVQEMVGLGQGISLVPEMAAQVDYSRDRVYCSLGKSAPKRTIALVWRRDRYQRRLVRAFIDAVRS